MDYSEEFSKQKVRPLLSRHISLAPALNIQSKLEKTDMTVKKKAISPFDKI